MEATNKPSASVATITHAARAMISQRPCKVVVRGGEVRVLIPPFPGPCWPAPSVTTPLYSTAVSQALRGGVVSEFRRIHLPKLSEKGYEQRSDGEFSRYTESEMDRKPRFGGSHGYAAGSLETFRTVSEGVFSEVRLVLRTVASCLRRKKLVSPRSE